jgi:NAD-dependent deacetylase
MIKILSGAGISAESNIQTFRGDNNSIWKKYNSDIVCDINQYDANKKVSLEFHSLIEHQLVAAKPNPAHYLFSWIEENFDSIHYTQNIDSLLEQAGCKNIIHVHGQARKIQCRTCDAITPNPDIGYTLESFCGNCMSTDIKPAVTFFW